MTLPLLTAALGIVLGILAGLLYAQRDLAARAAQVAELQARLDAERRAEAQRRDDFQLLNTEALRQNNEAFRELVAPMREALEKVDGKLAQVEKERVGAYEMLVAQVRAMSDGQRELSDRTRKLVDSLRSPTVRGRWGEIQLKRVCEMAGMLDHCDFVEQASTDSDGGKLRPDVTVKLPGGKLIIVDAKAPLMAYLDAMEASDEETRALKLREHARQVRDHITKLSAKSYWGQFEQTPEIVVMFLPGETFFSAALQYDPALIEYGVEQKVIPASPTTLIGLLRAIAYGWQQEQIARNAQEISAAGRVLYERIGVFAGHYTDLRKSLAKAVEAFNRSVGSLERNVLPQARRVRELGATTAPDLPDVGTVDSALRVLDVADDYPALAEANADIPQGVAR